MAKAKLSEDGIFVDFSGGTARFSGTGDAKNAWDALVSAIGSLDELLQSASYDEYLVRCSVSGVKVVGRQKFGEVRSFMVPV